MLGSVDIKVRPLKLAYLVDPGSSTQVREAIRLSSTLWGGSYCPIIPLHKRMPKTWRDSPLKAPSAKDVVLGYINSFDPDILVQLSKEVPTYVTETKLRIIKPSEIWTQEDIWDDPMRAHFGVGVFDLFDDIFKSHFKYLSKYPINIIIPKIPAKNSLLWASMFGEYPKNIIKTLKKNYFNALEIKEIDLNLSKVGEMFQGKNVFPRRVTQGNLEHYGRSGFNRDAMVFYFDASKTLDIVDYWNLRALGRAVFAMPKQLQENESMKKFLIEFLKANKREWKHQKGVFDTASMVRGRHCTMEEMQSFANTIDIPSDQDDPSNRGYFSLQHWYPRMWDEGEGRRYDGAEPNDTYEQQASIEITDLESFRAEFKPTFPKFLSDQTMRSDPCCANEISFRIYGTTEHLADVLPKSNGEKFIRAISSHVSFGNEWRVGRNGLVHLAKDTMTEYWDIPTSEKVFFAWLEDQGWSPELSNPGILAKQINKKLEGNTVILLNEKLIKLLDHMNGGENLYKETPTTTIELEDGRDLHVDRVKNQLSNPRHPKSKDHFHDYLLSKGVFRIGLKIKCPNCFRKSWYSLADIKDTCICPKCINSFSSIGNIHASPWHYKTAGPFSVPQHADGAFSVLLGVHFFTGHHIGGIKLSPVFSFNAVNNDGKNLEADFAGFWQQNSSRRGNSEGLLFAECKTFNEFKAKDFERMSSLGKQFPGAILVFCSLRKQLTTKELASLTKIAKKGRKYWKNSRPLNPVMILTGTELLNTRGIPYCWDQALQDKFRHTYDILSMSDATQQVYLKLPPWEEEWHAELKKKREKRKNKQSGN